MCKFVGKEEEEADKLRSILAQLEYKYRVDSYVNEGVPFNQHLYWPEKHPKTGEYFCEREDEGHVLKVFEELLYLKCILLCSCQATKVLIGQHLPTERVVV